MKKETIYFQNLNLEITYYIGKNAKDNFDVIDMGNPADIWFHIANCSSCHVVMILSTIENITSKIYNTILKRGALLCKENTKKMVSLRNVDITYTTIQNVQKLKTLGSVHIQNAKTITI